MASEKIDYRKNIEGWRKMPLAQRQSILRVSAVQQVISSMAMEGEPVSREWIRKNAR